MSRTILTSVVALGSLFLAGCPSLPSPEAILFGFWTVIPAEPGDADDFEYEVQFDERGDVIEISGTRADGGTVSLTVRNANTTLNGSAVTLVIPTDAGTVTFQGTLSADANSMEGSSSRDIDLGDLEAMLPGGELTLERVGTIDLCDFVTCAPGETCENGVCAPDDPCDGVNCDPGETCDDGQCVPDDPCDGVTCDPGETCENGDCVADDLCDNVTCDPGETCVEGVCVPDDPCENVTCDPGETCDNGVCVPEPSTPDPAAGEAFYMANGCAACHGADATGPPSLVGVDAQTLFDKMSGAVSHVGGTVAGVTFEDAENVEAWIASIQ